MDIKVPIIELFEYNYAMSMLEFLNNSFKEKGMTDLEIVNSYIDVNLDYISPGIAMEIMYRKNRSIGFGNDYGDIEEVDGIIELEGLIFEYRVQLNVYSNTRGESYKLNSILDEILYNGQYSIPINTYLDNGNIKVPNIGNASYDYAQDVKNNYMNPNIKTYDYHTIYEIKMTALQKYTIKYDYMEIGNIIGKLK